MIQRQFSRKEVNHDLRALQYPSLIQKLDNRIKVRKRQVDSNQVFCPSAMGVSSFSVAIYSVPLAQISLEDKVRAFDKEMDNRGIKIISPRQPDDD